eukprot:8685738-Alexandrium_andersonii.AAC.1
MGPADRGSGPGGSDLVAPGGELEGGGSRIAAPAGDLPTGAAWPRPLGRWGAAAPLQAAPRSWA